ncbi:uncharacterized protein [Nicotiana sylvestris]|uniref:uncharacterized protein n=1 Tax=Nicotiana sylvestris TaxID=4096 RepID=UPI00388C88E7
MMIRSSEVKPVKTPTVERSVNKLSMINGEPSVVVKKGSPSDIAAKQEKSEVVVLGVANKPIIIVEGAYEHRRALLKILNEAHVPDKISVNYLDKIANKIFEVNKVTFFDDELPVEGTEHNRALYLTVKCEDFVVTKVLVDNGSSANICPLFTLNKLKVDDERNHKNNIYVRGFDGGRKYSVGYIVLELTIGPVEFTMEFQVLEVAVSYNLLDASVPFIEVEDDKGPWVYQVFETVSVETVPEGKCVPTPKITSASVIVAFEMLKNGFVPGKGLGASLQGIIQPVSLPKNYGTFGLGFKPTAADVKRAKRLKQKAWVLPKPIPRLSRFFVKPSARKHPVTTGPSYVVDIYEELIRRFQRLFDDVNMVEVGEGYSKADVQFVGPNAKLNNWKAIPLPTRRESCSFYAGFNNMTCMRNLRPSLKIQSYSEIIIQEIECVDELEYDEDKAFEEINKELSHFEEKPNPNLNDTEAINLSDPDNVREIKISIYLEPQIREGIIKALFEYKDIFAWSYDDMPGLSTDWVVHKLPIDPTFPPIKQKLRKFKIDISVKTKEEVTKQLDAKHDITGRKEQAIYYLSKKFTSYEGILPLKEHVPP